MTPKSDIYSSQISFKYIYMIDRCILPLLLIFSARPASEVKKVEIYTRLSFTPIRNIT